MFTLCSVSWMGKKTSQDFTDLDLKSLKFWNKKYKGCLFIIFILFIYLLKVTLYHLLKLFQSDSSAMPKKTVVSEFYDEMVHFYYVVVSGLRYHCIHLCVPAYPLILHCVKCRFSRILQQWCNNYWPHPDNSPLDPISMRQSVSSNMLSSNSLTMC